MAKIIQWTSNQAIVFDDGKIINAKAYNKLKKESLYVGDDIELKFDEKNGYIITKVLKRKNLVIRPNVANIDQAIIVIASSPEPDFFTLDKILINCNTNHIDTILIVNKADINSKDFNENVKNQYEKAVTKLINTSIINKESIEKIKELLTNKTSTFVGQSAVGKSSILNLLNINKMQKTNILANSSGKFKARGKNTTKASQIFNIAENTFIADTPGFSSIDIFDIPPQDLAHYYKDFDGYINCKYSNCTHLKEKEDCAIYNAFKQGKINKNRYERFLILQKQIYSRWEHKYD